MMMNSVVSPRPQGALRRSAPCGRGETKTVSPPRRAFTLLEAVVVIAIFGVLAGLLLVAIAHARLVAARARCQSNLKQLGLAVLNYEAAHGVLPPGAVRGPSAPLGVPDGVSHGLWAFVLPQLGEGARAARYRWDVSCDDPVNGA